VGTCCCKSGLCRVDPRTGATDTPDAYDVPKVLSRWKFNQGLHVDSNIPYCDPELVYEADEVCSAIELVHTDVIASLTTNSLIDCILDG
jgi:hypothetical protein